MAAQDEQPDEVAPGALTVSVRYRFRLLVLVLSVLGLGRHGSWTAGVWQIWVTAPDGRRFVVQRFYDEDDARATAAAYEAQLRTEDPSRWARSKGCGPLADHLEQLARDGAG
jgi:hypothetical protein